MSVHASAVPPIISLMLCEHSVRNTVTQFDGCGSILDRGSILEKHQKCVFRMNVTGDFGNVTGHFGNVTERTGRQDWRCA
jgi:hypothetical protein